ncbi:Nrap protein [Yamadazyma tenuis ATCC 10573]|uniref:U3 small nucleolar RNA-associated protein 22 n=1 Tax=Candida tenuis (strain ATCC 10573 / BCRC 21748 / CBS 615 / JCM 9827 / NBRC 10315 / NRRL Y-1498 / VKM Y-70) TaxID=590646 RepID=G3B4V1_CANTC|nr:Nrap protein [Yamadazyma tenuis ATCC 10573]EGV63877.1 Nrap protein [Yamadazyma tenuis ATCC 10573]
MGKRSSVTSGHAKPRVSAAAAVDTAGSSSKPVHDSRESESEQESESDEEKPQKISHPPSKKQRKQISAQEIQVARETAELFKSNIFKLQIDELIKEVKLKDANIDKIEKVLHKLHDLIRMIPATENLTLEELEARFTSKKVVIPFPDPKPSKVNYKFSYLPPEDVSLVGSFGLKTGVSQNHGMSVDMILTMPKELFQPKDYLNYRALYKRAFYLAYLTDHLIPLTKKHNLPVKISYQYFNDDILYPCLTIESIKTDNPDDLCFHKTKFSIKLIVGLPFGVFENKKLMPNKNCIRIQSDSEELPPTPLYNSSILSSTAFDYYLKYLYTSKKATESFKDACRLGKIWLNQRGFSGSVNKGGFGHFEFAVLMSALLHGGGLNGNKILLHGFSSYQLFKGTIKYLATMDLSSGYLSFSSLIGENIASKFNPNEGFNVPTIFDKNLKLNILWKMTSYSYNLLKHDAIQTLELLNDVVKDRFDPILLHNSNHDQLRYDMLLNITIPDDLIEQFGPLEKITFLTFENFIMNKLYVILKMALGDRATQVVVKLEKFQNVFAIHKRKINSQTNNFIIGLMFNPDECEKLVTKGPDNDDHEEEVIKFRNFWGAKASLRRFKNGTIQNCVVWSIKESEPVTLSIIKYSLDHHLYKDISSNISTELPAFNKKLPIPLLPSGSNQPVISTSSFANLKTSFESLTRAISKLSLPLSVKSMFPASSSLRYTSTLQPVPFAVSNPDFWNEVILQFESSAKWPDELFALEKVKSAFLLKTLDELHKETAYKAFITQDDTIPFNSHITILRVLTPEGFGFKIRVLTERDETMYLRAVSNADKQKARAQDIYLKFNQKYIGVVKHSRTVSTLSHHFPFYSPTVRLFKIWLDSHLLLSHFSEELVELIALKPFVDPAPYSVPHSVENGFLRILEFLASWNWKDTSLILDLVKNDVGGDSYNELDSETFNKLSDKLTIQTQQMIEDNFTKIRKNDPTGIKTQFFIGSKDDPSGILWSNELTLPIASRLTALARSATEIIRSSGVNEINLNLLFVPVLQDYDFIIDIKSHKLSTSAGVLPSNSFKNLINNQTFFPDDIASKYDLTQAYIDDLNRKFGNVIIFSSHSYSFLNNDGHNIITGLFVPATLTKKKFRVNFGINLKPVQDSKDKDTEEVIINKESILDQIRLLGGDLISEVKIKG